MAVPSVTPDTPAFWREVAASPGGEAIATCIQCNTCTSSCPVELFEPAFRVRQVVARVKLGLREDVLSDPAIWACARCFACVAHCPKHVAPGLLMEAIRHLALRDGRDGAGPRHAKAFAESVREDGRINEARVTIRSLGIAGLLGQGSLPVRMALHGKAPRLRRHSISTVDEVQAILDATEGSE